MKNKPDYGIHTIVVADGGHDSLIPGRYLARSYTIAPSLTAYGKTPEEAVEGLRLVFAEVHPLAPWFQQVPWEMSPVVGGGIIFCPHD